MNELEFTDDVKQIRGLKRELWVVEGVLKFNLNKVVLDTIVSKFNHIDAVPSGYYYPELFQQK
jgi:hypothetical protein